MTIDSFYEPQERRVDDDVEYTTTLESIGDTALQVWRKKVDEDDNVTWESALPGTFFDWEFGGEEPIYFGATANLFAPADPPVTDNDRVVFIRKTPITNTTTFTDGLAFPSETFEYQVDKLTMILQEISGNKCDCIFGEGGGGGSACIPATFNTPLPDMTVDLDDVVVYTADVTGSAILTYQWKKDGIDIPGETGPTYTFTADVTILSGTVYTVVVANPCSSINSSSTLTINAAPGYACDSFESYIVSAGGFFWTPQINGTPNYSAAAGELVPEHGGGAPFLICGAPFNTQVIPGSSNQTNGLFDTCGSVYGWFSSGNSLQLQDPTLSIATSISTGVCVDPGYGGPGVVLTGIVAWDDADGTPGVTAAAIGFEAQYQSGDGTFGYWDIYFSITGGNVLAAANVPVPTRAPTERKAPNVWIFSVSLGAKNANSTGTLHVNGTEVATLTAGPYPPVDAGTTTQIQIPRLVNTYYQGLFIVEGGLTDVQITGVDNARQRNMADYTP